MERNDFNFMNALIIGGAGFVGKYLISQLAEDGSYTISATKLPHEKIDSNLCTVYDLNILDPSQIEEVLKATQPDVVFHLSAQSSVKLSWENPQLTVDVNIKGSLNVLDTIRKLGINPKIILIGSGEEYGYIKENECPIKEDNVLRAGNIYAITKATQNMLGTVYARAYNMDIVMVRAFNHIGAGQLPQFVVSDFCKQIADIEKGIKEPIMYVGNLTAKRDFTNVRDVVKAYTLLAKHGKQGETYNVGSGVGVSIQDILDMALSYSTANIEVRQDPNRMRPSDVPIIVADTSKIFEDTGWKPQTSLDSTILEVLEFWRNSTN
jgi:GDP-4-dehydro-6-deoxy-D-mannose reductase